MKRPKISFQPLATLYPLEEKIRTGGLGPCTGGDRQLQGPCCVSSIKAISQQPSLDGLHTTKAILNYFSRNNLRWSPCNGKYN
ncbi:unnamed protein product [Prunus armeniaca]